MSIKIRITESKKQKKKLQEIGGALRAMLKSSARAGAKGAAQTAGAAASKTDELINSLNKIELKFSTSAEGNRELVQKPFDLLLSNNAYRANGHQGFISYIKGFQRESRRMATKDIVELSKNLTDGSRKWAAAVDEFNALPVPDVIDPNYMNKLQALQKIGDTLSAVDDLLMKKTDQAMPSAKETDKAFLKNVGNDQDKRFALLQNKADELKQKTKEIFEGPTKDTASQVGTKITEKLKVEDLNKIKEISPEDAAKLGDDELFTSANKGDLSDETAQSYNKIISAIDEIDDDATRAAKQANPQDPLAKDNPNVNDLEEAHRLRQDTEVNSGSTGIDDKILFPKELVDIIEGGSPGVKAALKAEKRKKLVKIMLAAGALTGVTWAVIKKFLDDEGSPVPPATAAQTTQPNTPPPAPVPGNTTPATAAPSVPSATTPAATPAGSAKVPAPKATAPAAPAAGSSAKPAQQVKPAPLPKSLSPEDKIKLALKQQRYVDIARAYREARLLTSGILQTAVLDSETLTSIRQKMPEVNTDLIIKHILNQMLPMRGILIRYGLKQLKQEDAIRMATKMNNVFLIANDPSKQVIPFSLPADYKNIDGTSDFIKEVDRLVDRKDLMDAIERSLNKHLAGSGKPQGTVDFDPKAAAEFAAKMKTKESKSYDLEFSKWKKMFL